MARTAEQRLRAREASHAYDRLLQIFYYRGQQPEMLHATLKTLNLSELLGPSPELAGAYAIAHAVAGVIPSRGLAEAYLRNARKVLDSCPDPAVESYLLLLTGVYRSGTAEWARAREAFDRGIHLATSIGLHRRCDEIALGLANWHFLTGRLAGALGRSEAEPLPARRDPQAQAWRLLMRAQVALVQGSPQDAREPAIEAKHLIGQLQRSELIWTFAVLAKCASMTGETDESRGWADRALEQILAGPPVTFYCIDAYSTVCDVYCSLWQSARDSRAPHGDLAQRTKKAYLALKAFARVFPAAAPRAALYNGTIEAMNGHLRRARSAWAVSARAAETLRMPLDEVLAEARLAEYLPLRDPHRAPRLQAARRRAEELGAWALVERIKRLDPVG